MAYQNQAHRAPIKKDGDKDNIEDGRDVNDVDDTSLSGDSVD